MNGHESADATECNEMQHSEMLEPGDGEETDEIGPDLSVKQRLAVMALVQGGKMSAAAEGVGVDRVTVWRWMRQPAFAAEFEAASDAAYRQALREMQGAMLEASDVLRGLMRSQAPGVRLRAAQAVLSLAFKAREAAATEDETDRRRAHDREIADLFGR